MMCKQSEVPPILPLRFRRTLARLQYATVDRIEKREEEENP